MPRKKKTGEEAEVQNQNPDRLEFLKQKFNETFEKEIEEVEENGVIVYKVKLRRKENG
jgi:hypothetical protein